MGVRATVESAAASSPCARGQSAAPFRVMLRGQFAILALALIGCSSSATSRTQLIEPDGAAGTAGGGAGVGGSGAVDSGSGRGGSSPGGTVGIAGTSGRGGTAGAAGTGAAVGGSAGAFDYDAGHDAPGGRGGSTGGAGGTAAPDAAASMCADPAIGPRGTNCGLCNPTPPGFDGPPQPEYLEDWFCYASTTCRANRPGTKYGTGAIVGDSSTLLLPGPPANHTCGSWAPVDVGVPYRQCIKVTVAPGLDWRIGNATTPVAQRKSCFVQCYIEATDAQFVTVYGPGNAPGWIRVDNVARAASCP